MLAEHRTHTALPATDLKRAERFYAEKLGLTPTERRDAGLVYESAAGTAILLFPTPIADRGGHTQAGIGVADVEAEVAELRSRGVVFEEYPGASDGIVTEADGSKAAWFKDSEGNLLVLVQFS